MKVDLKVVSSAHVMVAEMDAEMVEQMADLMVECWVERSAGL